MSDVYVGYYMYVLYDAVCTYKCTMYYSFMYCS